MLSLEKTAKRQCPNCGERKFKYYVTEGGEYLHPSVGRCNREVKCAYHLKPREYFAAQPTSNWMPKATPIKAKSKPAVIGEIPRQYLEQSLAGIEQDAFFKFLLSRYDAEAVLQVCRNYLLGNFEGYTTFWRVDEHGHLNTAKLIAYNATTGKRVRSNYAANWIHARLKKRDVLPEEFEYRRCFFGQHRLRNTNGLIALVESEKTAIIAALELPNYLWLACGGRTQLNPEKLQVFGQRQVILFPDGDAYAYWSAIAWQAQQLGVNVIVSDLLERELTPEQKADGYDLADYLLLPHSEPTVVAQDTFSCHTETPIASHTDASIAEQVVTCSQCGDYLTRAGECLLCKRSLPF